MLAKIVLEEKTMMMASGRKFRNEIIAKKRSSRTMTRNSETIHVAKEAHDGRERTPREEDLWALDRLWESESIRIAMDGGVVEKS